MRNRSCFLIIYLLLLLPLVSYNQETVKFPLKISENQRYLVDQNNRPFFYQADTPWFIFYKLTLPEVAKYLDKRIEQGFNTIQVMFTGGKDLKNIHGEGPFLGDNDFTRPNEKYFRRVDSIMEMIAEKNLLIATVPLWAGCCRADYAGEDRDGNPLPMNRQGAEITADFGTYLAERYCHYDNLLWIMGGDNDPFWAYEEHLALAERMSSLCDKQLFTYHAASTHSSTDVLPDTDWLDISMVYTYYRGFQKAWNKVQPDVYEVSRSEYYKKPTRPFFLGESTYEREHLPNGSPHQVRKQAYWNVLSGSCGHAYGSTNWKIPDNWREVLEMPGAYAMKHLRDVMEKERWYEYQPDWENNLLLEGKGRYASNDYTVSAIHRNGKKAMIYVPSPRAMTVDLTQLVGNKGTAKLLNPANGQWQSMKISDSEAWHLSKVDYPTKKDCLILVALE